ncbi:MAG TPA: S8 family serine peptidase [Thermoanaerobaculia bacterium]|nr:S8 family serine peptidase [Thermoanaerobaculia bacterium]
MSRRGRISWGLALVAALLLATGAEAQERRRGGGDSPYAIHLKSGSFTPDAGLEPALRDEVLKARRGTVGLVQLEDAPDETVRAQLAKAGVVLLEYVPNNTWIARLPADVTKVESLAGVRWVGRLLPEDKLSPDLAQALVEKGGKRELTLDVEAFNGSLEKAVARAEALGGRVVLKDPSLSVFRVVLPRGSVRSLAASDAVLWLSPDLPRIPFNNRSRVYSRGNEVQAAPYGLNGAGVQLGIWDGGQIFAHSDFGTRLTIAEAGAITDHGTHVAGTMAGDGTNSVLVGPFPPFHFRGFATAADIIGYDFTDPNFPYSEHNGAINTFGIDNSQNSWGADISTANGNCTLFGNYHSYSREFDRVVTGVFGRRIPIVFANGNDRDDGDCGMSAVPPYINYANVPIPATAKNVISVGAVNGDDGTMTTFSSWGPTDDGRIKPDIVAAGDNTLANPFGSIVSTWSNNGYAGIVGTSMAAPAVSGSIGLLLQRYRAVCPATGTDPLPSTVKALLLHTARDLDDATSWFNRGPDYASGYGALDIQAAVDMLPFHREDQVDNGQVDTFQITVTRQSDLKVTLVWDDVAAPANAAVALINNLDLELIDPLNNVHRPWVLNPGAPANAATRAADNRNVVEMVLVDNVTAATAGVWTIRVIGTNVPSGPQGYSLVTQHLRHADLTCQGAPAADAWIMDKDAPLSPVDTGGEPNPDPGPMWISNQIWVRHADDNVMVHQNPEFGMTPNYVYARVRNDGATTLNTVRVMVYYADANAGLGWPQDWTLIGERTLINMPGNSSAVIQGLPWNPPGTGHYCLYVRLLTDQDSFAFAEGGNVNVNTRNNDEIAWRNVNVVDLIANSQGGVEVLMANTVEGEAELEINVDLLPDPRGHTLLDFATIDVRISEELRAHLDRAGIELKTDEGFEQVDDLTFRMVKPTGFFTPIPVVGRQQFPVEILVQKRSGYAPSPVYTIDFNQNFPPVSAGNPSEAGKAFDPEDPNAGGVRYEVHLPLGTGTVYGKVTDGEGNPLPGVNISSGSIFATVTDANGSYELTTYVGDLPVTLTAGFVGFGGQEVDVELNVGEKVEQNFQLEAEK